MALRTLGRNTLTVDNTAGGVQIAAALRPNHADGNKNIVSIRCTVETAEIRASAEANAAGSPTNAVTASAHGELYAVGDVFMIHGADDIENFRAIRTGGSSAALQCEALGSGNPAS